MNLNGQLLSAETALIHPDNRAFRYGEGLFETLRLHRSTIPLWELHWNRLKRSFAALNFILPKHFSEDTLKQEVLALAAKNECSDAARIRITIFKGEGGIWEEPSRSMNYLIQCWPFEQKEFSMNQNGLDLGLFTTGWKSCDGYSHLKSNQYLLYALAANYAKTQKWNEALVLNQYGRICDATIANVFYSKSGIIYTPDLKEGCVDGVMRTWLIQQLQQKGTAVQSTILTTDDLLAADEVFLTNAIYGIRWVKSFGHQSYPCELSAKLFQQLISPLFP